MYIYTLISLCQFYPTTPTPPTTPTAAPTSTNTTTTTTGTGSSSSSSSFLLDECTTPTPTNTTNSAPTKDLHALLLARGLTVGTTTAAGATTGGLSGGTQFVDRGACVEVTTCYESVGVVWGGGLRGFGVVTIRL